MTSIKFNMTNAVRGTCTNLLKVITCGCLNGRKVNANPSTVVPGSVSVKSWPPIRIEDTWPDTRKARVEKAQQDVVLEIDVLHAVDEVAAAPLSSPLLETLKKHFAYKHLICLLPKASQAQFELHFNDLFAKVKEAKSGVDASNGLRPLFKQAIEQAVQQHTNLETYFRIVLKQEFVGDESGQQATHDYIAAMASANVALQFGKACADAVLSKPINNKEFTVEWFLRLFVAFDKAFGDLKFAGEVPTDPVKIAKREKLQMQLKAIAQNCADLVREFTAILPAKEKYGQIGLLNQEEPNPTAAKPKKRSLQEKYNLESALLVAKLNPA